jgi:hypothetical protein
LKPSNFNPAGLSCCVFFSLSLFVSIANPKFPSKLLCLWGYYAVAELSQVKSSCESPIMHFRDFGVAEAPPGFQASWSGRFFFF